jgi:hypothetical protein
VVKTAAKSSSCQLHSAQSNEQGVQARATEGRADAWGLTCPLAELHGLGYREAGGPFGRDQRS